MQPFVGERGILAQGARHSQGQLWLNGSPWLATLQQWLWPVACFPHWDVATAGTWASAVRSETHPPSAPKFSQLASSQRQELIATGHRHSTSGKASKISLAQIMQQMPPSKLWEEECNGNELPNSWANRWPPQLDMVWPCWPLLKQLLGAIACPSWAPCIFGGLMQLQHLWMRPLSHAEGVSCGKVL